MIRSARPVCLLVLIAACGRDQIHAPPPLAEGEAVADSAVPLPPSSIHVPVEYDLAPALAWLEETIPRRLGDLDERQQIPGNDRLSFAFTAQRTPFRLRLDGTTATLSSVITYRGRGWYNPPVLPTVSGSCGLNDEPPRMRITVRSTITPTADWRLRARSRVVALAPLTDERRDRCVVTVAAINVTGRVLDAVEGVLNRELAKVDQRLARYDLRGRVADVWEFLVTPVRLRDSLWLVVDPAAIRLDQVRNEGTTLHTAIGMTAYPRIIGGLQPMPAARELPPLERTGGGSGLSLLSEGRIGWGVLSGILRRELAGDTIRVAGRALVLEDLVVSGLDDGRIALGLTLRGAARGTIYLVGRPEYDSHGAVLTMPDLEFDVRSRSLMVAGLAWLAGGQVEDYLRTNLRLSLATLLDDGLAMIERELSRELAPGVAIATALSGGQVYRIRPRAEALLVDALAHGSAELRLMLVPGRRVSQE